MEKRSIVQVAWTLLSFLLSFFFYVLLSLSLSLVFVFSLLLLLVATQYLFPFCALTKKVNLQSIKTL